MRHVQDAHKLGELGRLHGPQRAEADPPLGAVAVGADSRHEQVHRGHSFPVVIQSHVKRFNLFRKIENRHRTLEMFFGQPALMLRLQVQSVLDRKLEFLAALFQKIDSFSVSGPLKRALENKIETRE